jgi:hypothetical protein
MEPYVCTRGRLLCLALGGNLDNKAWGYYRRLGLLCYLSRTEYEMTQVLYA